MFKFFFLFFLGGTVTRKHWLCEHDCMIMGFTGFYKKKIGVINQKKATSARVYFFGIYKRLFMIDRARDEIRLNVGFYIILWFFEG